MIVNNKSKILHRCIAAVCSILFLFMALFTTGCSVLEAGPSWISAVITENNQITVKWEPVDGADKYRVFRKAGDSSDFKFICDIQATVYVDNEVENGISYAYKIKASKSGKNSADATSDSVTMVSAPKDIKTEYSSEAVLLSWQPNGAKAYEIYVGDEEDGEYTLVGATQGSNYSLGIANRGKHVKLRSVNVVDGKTIYSDMSKQFPLSDGVDIKSIIRMDKYTCVLQFNMDIAAEEYAVYRADSKNGEYVKIGVSYEGVYYDTDAMEDTYYYKVSPITSLGEGHLSEAATIETSEKSITGLIVFMYHEFVTQEDLDNGVLFDEYAIWYDEFEADLKWLKDNGYTSVTSEQVIDYLEGKGSLPEKAVLISIDDGKWGVYKHAWPLLKKYDMVGSLSVIGERIDESTGLDSREGLTAPYCTWDEIKEMSDSGNIEIISHTYYRHRFRNNGHNGANIAPGETEEAFYGICKKDYAIMQDKLNAVLGKGTYTQAYPYSKRSLESDRAWLKCGYKLLFAGDGGDVRRSYINYYIDGMGLNYFSSLTRRITRHTGTSVADYVTNALKHDAY